MHNSTDLFLPIRTCKSDILDFSDLSQNQQNEVINRYNYEGYNPDEDLFVKFNYPDGTKILPLSMFIRNIGNSRYHGSYCTSNSGGYAIIISRDNARALISLF